MHMAEFVGKLEIASALETQLTLRIGGLLALGIGSVAAVIVMLI
jgi:hypothetical protein